MNKIDPDEDEDEDGNPIPNAEKKPSLGSYKARAQAAQQQQSQLAQQYNNNQIVNMNEPGRSSHQPHQQAWLQYQQQNQQQLQQSRQQPLRQSSRATPQKKNYNEDSYYSGSTEGMVLDPLTGDFVPAGSNCDEDDDGDVQVLNNEKPVVIKLGQLASSKHSSENSTQVCCVVILLPHRKNFLATMLPNDIVVFLPCLSSTQWPKS